MMYEHIVSKLKEEYQDKEVSQIKEHFAIQFNVWGEGHGALYLEIRDGKIHIEPYEYYDRNTLISTDAQTLLGIAAGKIDPVTYGDLYVEGDISGLALLRDISTKQSKDEMKEIKNKETEKKEGPGKKEKNKKSTRKKSVKKTVKDKAGSAAETVKDKAESAAETVKGKAESAAETVKGKAESAAETVKDKAESAAETVKDKAESAVESVKDKVESAVESVKDKRDFTVKPGRKRRKV